MHDLQRKVRDSEEAKARQQLVFSSLEMKYSELELLLENATTPQGNENDAQVVDIRSELEETKVKLADALAKLDDDEVRWFAPPFLLAVHRLTH